MKPRISQRAMNMAELMNGPFYEPTIKDMERELRFWLGSLAYWKPLVNLRMINLARSNIIEYTMALELKINRPHWYRRTINVR